MLTSVLLSWALLQTLPAMQGAQMGLVPLEDIRSDQALLSEIPGLELQPELKRPATEQAEEALLQEAEALDEALDPQDREPRSPRRCLRLHESCLGHQIPCCDPCATCYCRFFNAFCYCRKLGTATHPCSRT
ncbi:agouti-related protein [Rhynchocyon petersi]